MVNRASRQRTAKRMRWVGRIICLVITIFGATMLIGEAVSEILSHGFITTSMAGSLLVLIGIIALAGCILSWWKDLLASIMLVITSAGLGVHIGIFAGHNHFLAWLMLGLPYLIAGLSLFYAWRLSRPVEGHAVLSSSPEVNEKQ
ncbi:hypothetical protein ES703_107139 [subsurface metagenome]